MDGQLERTPVAESHCGEVTDVSRRNARQSQILGERHNRRVHESEAEVGVLSQMIAAALASATEQLAFVPALGERPDSAGAGRLRMPPVLFEHQRQLLPNELRARHTPLAGGARQEAIVLRVERDGRRLLPG